MLQALEDEIDRFAKHVVKVLSLPTPTSYHLRPAKSSWYLALYKDRQCIVPFGRVTLLGRMADWRNDGMEWRYTRNILKYEI